MSAVQALVLGIVQGLGEFLPISSSGHLVLLQKIFKINEGAMSFDIIVHLGTLLALCIVMRKRLLVYLREPLSHIPKMVVLGTIPTVIIALAFGSFFSKLFDTGISLGVGFIFTALLLYFAETHRKDESEFISNARSLNERSQNMRDSALYGVHERRRQSYIEKRVTPAGSLIVGVAQGIAIIPGVSRSGSTIAAGIMCDFGRPAAIEYAFLMSIPVTLMAVAQDVLKLIMNRGGDSAEALGAVASASGAAVGAVASAADAAAGVAADAAAVANAASNVAGPIEMVIGFAAALVTGFFAARYILRVIQRIKLTWFSLYVGILGALILLDQLFFGIVFDKIFI